MKRFALLIITALVLLAACDDTAEPPIATPLLPAPTFAPATADTAPPTTATDPTTPAEPTAEPALPTVQPSPTLATPADAAPTDPPTAAPTATDEPSPTAPATTEILPTDPPADAPTPVSFFAPGQQDGGSLATGGTKAYLVDGRPFQPVILFVEPTNELNVGLAAYAGDQTGQTTPEGVTPLAAADNAMAGRPEVLVLSPEANGVFTLVVRAVAGQGAFAAHLYDLTTPASGVAVQQPDTLAAGEVISYTVTSRGPRPVIVVADPSDQSDIALDILAEDGTLLTTANYSGAGGVETAYVLPLGETPYTVQVREANGGPSAYQIVIITVE